MTWKKDAQAPKNLTVKTLTQGTGAEIDAGGAVNANYTGWQWDGTDPFDTSFKSGAPVAFSLGNVIQGWKCGLAGHHVGDRVLMSIPPELAYGNKAAQDAQAAQAGGAQKQQNPAGTLVFVVEIVDGASSKVSGASATATMEGEEAVSERGLTVSGELGQPATLSIGADAALPIAQGGDELWGEGELGFGIGQDDEVVLSAVAFGEGDGGWMGVGCVRCSHRHDSF